MVRRTLLLIYDLHPSFPYSMQRSDRVGSLYPVAIALSRWPMDAVYVVASCCWCGMLHYRATIFQRSSVMALTAMPASQSTCLMFYRKKYLFYSYGEFSPAYTSVLHANPVRSRQFWVVFFASSLSLRRILYYTDSLRCGIDLICLISKLGCLTSIAAILVFSSRRSRDPYLYRFPVCDVVILSLGTKRRVGDEAAQAER
ncbi:hypothetical protein BJ912DRAFT_1069887 [Pholiota molesta]|nr:hypothetical protein BJ912DRAFT_1069887 [Pholiota molesta]